MLPKYETKQTAQAFTIRRWWSIGFIPLLIFAVGCPTGGLNELADSEEERYLIAVPSREGVADREIDSNREPAPTDGTGRIGEAREVDADKSTDPLTERVAAVLDRGLRHRRLASDVNAAWQVMHGVLAYGRDFVVHTPAGPQPAVEYVLVGGPLRGFTLRGGDRFEIDGRQVRGVIAELDPGQKIGQGHRDQWVAYMARCGLTDDVTVTTADGVLTMAGWIRQMEWDVPLNFEAEYSWTLTALLAHRPTTHRWTARDGRQYSIESLLESEIRQLSPTSACGGSHRLCAIATAVNHRREAGLPVAGVWQDAADLVSLAIEHAHDYQNPDGTFSSHYFDRPGWSPDLVTALGTTGHLFEFLAVAGDDELLALPWVRSAGAALCDILEQTESIDLECGALYHALSGLAIYDQRTRGSAPAPE